MHIHSLEHKVVPAVFLPEGNALCLHPDTDSSFTHFFYVFVKTENKEKIKKNAQKSRRATESEGAAGFYFDGIFAKTSMNR